MQLELLKSEEKEQKIVNVASVPHRSPFRYPGGKTWFVPTFRKWMQSKSKRPNVLLEPFAGGAIISLTAVFENLADKAVIVELDEDVASVWQAIFSKDNSALCKKIVDFKMTSETVQKTFEKKPKNTLE
ncbi:MAG: DNA adenine methylase, partial [Pseudobdellovibrionaceae bacterium]